MKTASGRFFINLEKLYKKSPVGPVRESSFWDFVIQMDHFLLSFALLLRISGQFVLFPIPETFSIVAFFV